MTQTSRPWAGRTIGDAGPYTHENWWDVWQAMQGGSGALAGVGNIGVFYSIPNRLAPTSVANNSVTIASGAALVDGLFYDNTAPVTFSIPSATAGNERDDRIVIRKIFSGVVQTARLLLLTGSEVASPGPGTPPALTQDVARATYWDLPLARINVTDGGVITITDEREYIGLVQKSVQVDVHGLYNYITPANSPEMTLGGVRLLDGVNQGVSGEWLVPDDYISDLVCDVFVLNGGNAPGDMWYIQQQYSYGIMAVDNWSTHVATIAARQVSAITPPSATYGIIPACRATFPVGLVPGMWAGMTLERKAADILDTSTTDLYITWFMLTYNSG